MAVSTITRRQEAVEHNASFVSNIFRGELEASEIFPFPEVLTEEQTEYLQMSIDPISKILTVEWTVCKIASSF